MKNLCNSDGTQTLGDKTGTRTKCKSDSLRRPLFEGKRNHVGFCQFCVARGGHLGNHRRGTTSHMGRRPEMEGSLDSRNARWLVPLRDHWGNRLDFLSGRTAEAIELRPILQSVLGRRRGEELGSIQHVRRDTDGGRHDGEPIGRSRGMGDVGAGTAKSFAQMIVQAMNLTGLASGPKDPNGRPSRPHLGERPTGRSRDR
jgi:hypothetical protein